jgi:hypothetical protein
MYLFKFSILNKEVIFTFIVSTMKSLHFFLPTLVLLFLGCLFSSSCNKKDEEPENNKLGTADVRVFKNGALLTEYSDNFVKGFIDDGDFSVEFTGNNNKHVLSLSISDFKAGTFRLEDMHEPGSAHLLYYSEDLPGFSPGNIGMFIFPNGTIKVDKVADNRCSGNFTANGVHGGDNQNYSMEGTFDCPFIEL